MTALLDRARWSLLLRWTPARLVYLGWVDGNAGTTPQLPGNWYYMGGYDRGRAKLVARSCRKA